VYQMSGLSYVLELLAAIPARTLSHVLNGLSLVRGVIGRPLEPAGPRYRRSFGHGRLAGCRGLGA
jgi:hypothetical protein